MYSFSASYSDLKLAPNFKFGNWSIPSNQRLFIDTKQNASIIDR